MPDQLPADKGGCISTPVERAGTSYDVLRTLRLQLAYLYVRGQPCPLIFGQTVPASKQVSLIRFLHRRQHLLINMCLRHRAVCATAKVGAGGRAKAVPSRLLMVMKSVYKKP